MDRKELLNKNEILKEGYIKLLNDKDVLLEWGKPQLEALYATKIGVWQIKKLQQQLRIKALKRRMEMVQMCINKNQAPDYDEIELNIAKELAEAEWSIMQETAKLEYAKILLTNLETPERSAELRKIFRRVAKQLHPDINGELSETQMEIWHKIKEAYNTGDLERLKALEVAYETEIEKLQRKQEEVSDAELQLRNEVLKEGIRLLEEEIKKIRSCFPFTLEEQIKNEEWVAEQQELLQKEIGELENYENQLEEEYKKLRENYGTE